MKGKLVNYGGQAVIEGVLMRGKRFSAVAMRSLDGTIVTNVKPLSGIYQSSLVRIPFLRGLILLWDSLGLGMQALVDSANLQTGEKEKLEGPALYLTLTLTFVAAIAIFFLVPAGVGWLIEHFLHWNAWLSNLLEGVIRLLFLVGYVWLIGLTPDIARVFGYHGAEHKTINAYEKTAEMVPSCVAAYSVEHPRCGTAFLLTLMVLSLLLFTLLGPLPIAWRLVSRIIMIPVLAGIAYEFIRWTGNHQDLKLVRIIMKPNLALQHLTTREPDEKMIEVAITAFKAMLKAEGNLN
jgi:uncharacterized protein YqhQ